MFASSEMTFSAISASAVSSAWVARPHGLLHLVGHRDELVDDRVELVEVGITHDGDPTQAWCPQVKDERPRHDAS